jgi:hypothetical protein
LGLCLTFLILESINCWSSTRDGKTWIHFGSCWSCQSPQSFLLCKRTCSFVTLLLYKFCKVACSYRKFFQ